MTKIIGIAGSLRAGSYNKALLRTAATLMPPGATLEIASIQGIPLYDGDVETNEGIPAVVAQLKDLIAGSDGVLLVTPEYNNSMPGVLKNTIDWLSRPPADIARVFGIGRLPSSAHRPAGSAPSWRRKPGCRYCAPWGRVPGSADA